MMIEPAGIAASTALIDTVAARIVREGLGDAHTSRLAARFGIGRSWSVPTESVLHPPGGWDSLADAKAFLIGGGLDSATGQGMGGALIHADGRWGAVRFGPVTHWDGAAQVRTGATTIRTPHPEVQQVWDHLQLPLHVVYR